MKTRGFEVVKGFEDKGINLPKRQTKHAAGYDFEAAQDIVIPSFPSCYAELIAATDHYTDVAVQILDSTENHPVLRDLEAFNRRVDKMREEEGLLLSEDLQNEYIGFVKQIIGKEMSAEFDRALTFLRRGIKPTLVPTGIKAYMLEDEKLDLYNRSSGPIKKSLVVTNGVGLVDSDYYENPDNDGHIMFQVINYGKTDVVIKKGERIGQGVFTKFLKVDSDVEGETRTGGHGSTSN